MRKKWDNIAKRDDFNSYYPAANDHKRKSRVRYSGIAKHRFAVALLLRMLREREKQFVNNNMLQKNPYPYNK